MKKKCRPCFLNSKSDLGRVWNKILTVCNTGRTEDFSLGWIFLCKSTRGKNLLLSPLVT